MKTVYTLFFLLFISITAVRAGVAVNLPILVDSLEDVSDEIEAYDVIDNYIKAIGGRWRLNRIKNLTTKELVEYDNMKLEIIRYKKKSRKYLKVMQTGDVVFEKRIFDGRNAYVIDRRGNYRLTGDSITELQYEAFICKELKYYRFGFELKLLGIAKINARDAYLIEITEPTGTKYYDYFDRRRGLKMRTMKTYKTEEGEITVVTDYRKYRKLKKKKVRFPREMITNYGFTSFKTTVKEIDIKSNIKASFFKLEEHIR